MATFNSPDLNSKNLPAIGGTAVIYDGKIAATPDAAAVMRFCRIPAGVRLSKIEFRIATAFGATWTGKWFLQSCDETSIPTIGGSGTSTELQASMGAVFGFSGAIYNVSFEPVTTRVDCFVAIVLTALGTPAAGAATVTAFGMVEGAR
jgi:hypothetical protein